MIYDPILELQCNQINIKAAQAVGSAYIITFPVGANIYIDNVLQQTTTPTRIDNIPVGEHAYKITLPGYVTAEGLMKIAQSQTYDLIIAMEKLPRDISIILLASFAIGILGLYLFSPRECIPLGE